jgi:signal transduction histidine kinase
VLVVARATLMTSILHLEDNLMDHRLVTARLTDAGIDVRMNRVDTEQAFRAALLGEHADLVLTDLNLPQFDGRTALQLAREAWPDVPVIIVSGAVGELAAIDILKAGATDYVLKDHLERLVPAVRRALRETEDRIARQQAEQSVREARDQAQAANRAKDNFLAILSHELRTPLTPSLTTLQMLETDPSLPQEFHEHVEMVRRNVELEVRLIDDLLDLTRIGRGKLELTLRAVDAHETIKQVLAICDADLRGKCLHVKVELAATQPRVHADPARLHQILWNIVKNAVKFNQSGGDVGIRTSNTTAGYLEIQISDTGIGIEPDVMGKIFDAFQQGGKEITKRFGGMGLGLALSRTLAEQHGGSLTAFSQGKGAGSTFTLTLPLSREPEAKCTPASSAGETATLLGNRRVLLVEDHPDTARAMSRLLKRWGCEVEVADSVSLALKAANALPFDIVISDIGLPDGSGMDLMRQLCARRPIKGIAISGFGMDEDVEQSRQAGFSEHLVKPVDLQKLEGALRRLMEDGAKRL